MKGAIWISLPALALAGAARAGPITVNVTGVEKAVSRVYAAACDRRGFLSRDFLDRCVVTASAPVSGKTATILLPNVPEGRFAVMVFHDVDGDGKLDFRLGLPAEPGGFSGPGLQIFPTFGQSAFEVGPAAISIDVKLRCVC